MALRVPIAKPEWVPEAVQDTLSSLRLIQSGKVPSPIVGFFLRTAAMRLLRCVYGSDLETAAAIRADVLADEQRKMDMDNCNICNGTATVDGRPCPHCFPELCEKDSPVVYCDAKPTLACNACGAHYVDYNTGCPACEFRKGKR